MTAGKLVTKERLAISLEIQFYYPQNIINLFFPSPICLAERETWFRKGQNISCPAHSNRTLILPTCLLKAFSKIFLDEYNTIIRRRLSFHTFLIRFLRLSADTRSLSSRGGGGRIAAFFLPRLLLQVPRIRALTKTNEFCKNPTQHRFDAPRKRAPFITRGDQQTLLWVSFHVR